MGIVAIIIGILSIGFIFLPVPVSFSLLAVAGLTLGIVDVSKKSKKHLPKGQGIVGIVLNVVAILVVLHFMVFIAPKVYEASAEKAKSLNIADVEKAKAVLTLPSDSMPGAIGADKNTCITNGEGLSKLLSILKINDLSALTVGGNKIDIGNMNGIEAHYHYD